MYILVDNSFTELISSQQRWNKIVFITNKQVLYYGVSLSEFKYERIQ